MTNPDDDGLAMLGGMRHGGIRARVSDTEDARANSVRGVTSNVVVIAVSEFSEDVALVPKSQIPNNKTEKLLK